MYFQGTSKKIYPVEQQNKKHDFVFCGVGDDIWPFPLSKLFKALFVKHIIIVYASSDLQFTPGSAKYATRCRPGLPEVSHFSYFGTFLTGAGGKDIVSFNKFHHATICRCRKTVMIERL